MEMVEAAEIWTFDESVEDDTFLYTAVTTRFEGDFYHGAVPLRLPCCRLDQILSLLRAIPVDNILPIVPSNFTGASNTTPGECSYKPIRLISYGEQRARDGIAIPLLRKASV